MLLTFLLSQMPTQALAFARGSMLLVFWAAGLVVLYRAAKLMGRQHQRGGWLLLLAVLLLGAGWKLSWMMV